ncbi:Maf family protein [Demequina lutea]|uniref:Nucleoside triphosphate pyrophosphatase n=1 Tax=Demequina lutea TaxID=431489 RepID=A0A7Z0CGN8_9MICO|nr:Maf family protein [Demequina lutea]NYI39899.1 septum formation protein [Demequina lutea]
MITFTLASASPARLATLRSAGFDPIVVVSGVDEDAVLDEARAASGGTLTHADAILILAKAKAEDVASRASAGLVLGCDSMLELDGEIMGKPRDAVTATARWRAMRGRSGALHTGHWLVDCREGHPGATGGVASTAVHFADLSDAEIAAYVATGEPLNVAGAFTVDGIGGSFVESIEGDHHNVVGVSLPLFRRLLGERGVSVTELWRANGA